MLVCDRYNKCDSHLLTENHTKYQIVAQKIMILRTQLSLAGPPEPNASRRV